MLRAPVSLSHTAYEVLWEREGLDEMPAAIAVDYPLRAPDNGAMLARNAFAELTDAGLASGTEPRADLRAALRALVSGDQRCYAVIPRPDGTSGGALVATAGEQAVLAILDADRLRLTPVRAAEAVPALVSTLPPAPPGRGRAINLRRSSFDDRGYPVQPADGGILQSNDLADPAAGLRALMDRPRTFVAYLYVSRRASSGRQVRCAHPLVAFDLEGDGRWFTLMQRDASGEDWIVAAPATFDILVDQLRRVRDSAG